jgi:hypothetical protein
LPRTQKDNHGHNDGQEEHNQEHKKMTRPTTIGRKNTTKNTRVGLGRCLRRGDQEHKRRTTEMTRNGRTRTQEGDHGHDNG